MKKQTNKQANKNQASKQRNKHCKLFFQLQNWKLWRWLRTSGRKLDGDPRNRVLVKTDHSKPPIFVQDWTKSLCKFTKSLHCKLNPPIFISPRKTSPLKTTGRKGHKPLRKVCKKLFSQLQNRKPSRGLRTSGRRLDGDLRNSQNGSLETPYILSNPLYFNFARFRFSQLLSF